MSRTSIDGLIIRSSGQTRQGANTRRTTSTTRWAKVQDNLQKNSSSGQKKPATVPRSTDGIKVAAVDDFLSPEKTYDFDMVQTFEAEDANDWSTLLGQLDDNTEAKELSIDEELIGEDKEEAAKTKRGEKKSQKKGKGDKKPKKRWKKIVLIIILLILVVGGAVAYFWGDAIISRLTNGNSGLWDAFHSLVSEEVPFETDEHGRTNVLIFGTEGYDMAGSAHGGTHDGAQLTDSIMVISFDQKTKDVALLSLPRDLKVSMACSAGKINEVFWCNNQGGDNEEAGALALAEQLGEIIGIDFQYWAHVNWGSLVSIIDTIGGITVTLDEDINDYYYTGAVAKAGVPITVNGEQALGLARARHGTTGGDFTRGNTQQKIVEGIVQKLLENGVGIGEALGLLNILGDNLRSNFSTDNIKAGVRLLSGFDTSTIRNVPLADYDNNKYYVKTAMINNISYVVPASGVNNYTEIHNYIDQMFSSNPAVREGADIVVFNGTETAGVAGAEKAKLEADGFMVSNVGDAETGVCAEKYCVYTLNEEMAGTKTALESRYQTTAKAASELPGSVWAGNADFVIIVGQAETE